MEHLEQLTSQFMSAQKQFIAYKSRLNVVRTDKEQRQIEGKYKAQNWTHVKVIQNLDLNISLKSKLNLTLVNISDLAPGYTVTDFWTLSSILFFYLKQRFGDWTVSPSSGKSLLIWARLMKQGPVSGQQNKYKTGYIN
jgi:hypothetical protein